MNIRNKILIYPFRRIVRFTALILATASAWLPCHGISQEITRFENGYLTFVNTNPALYYRIEFKPNLSGNEEWDGAFKGLRNIHSTDAEITVPVGTLFRVSGQESPWVAGTAISTDILSGRTALVNDEEVVGAMANVGRQHVIPGTSAQAIVQGYHDGTGEVAGDANLVADNIRFGTTIFGVAGMCGTDTLAYSSSLGVPQTGRTSASLPGDDGDLRLGVAWPEPRFTVISNGIDEMVRDNLTGLMWSRTPHLLNGNSDAMDWNLAIDFCNGLEFAGHSDWRLPNVRELNSLVDYGRINPPLPSGHPFEGIRSGEYWSSSSLGDEPMMAWIVAFSQGGAQSTGVEGERYVWPVRGGRRTAASSAYWFEISNPYHDVSTNAFKGQIHFHSTVSDGIATMQQMATAYKQLGFDFIAPADHDAMGSDPGVDGLLWIAGVEETANGFEHIVAFGATGNIGYGYQDEAVPRLSPQEMINAIRSQGAFPILAHPNLWAPQYPNYSSFQLENLTNYLGIEIYNFMTHSGGYEYGYGGDFGHAVAEWDDLLRKGKRVWGFATDDAHQSAGSVGKGWIVVHARELTRASILEAVAAGAFYSTRGPDIRVSLDESTLTLTVETSIPATLRVLGDQGVLAQAASSTMMEYPLSLRERYVRAEVVSATGREAWSQPIFIEHGVRREPPKYVRDGHYSSRDALRHGWRWRVTNQTAVITNHTATYGSGTFSIKADIGNPLAIPDTIDGLPVVEIGPLALSSKTNLWGLSGGRRIQRVGQQAFQLASNLHRVDFLEEGDLRNIGPFAFHHTQITNVSAVSLTHIGWGAFQSTPNLKTVNAPSVLEVETNAFYQSGVRSIQLPEARIIRRAAFMGALSLSEILIPKVEHLGLHVFGSIPVSATRRIEVGPVVPTSDGDVVDIQRDNQIMYYPPSATYPPRYPASGNQTLLTMPLPGMASMPSSAGAHP
jgi:hypothetical protein